MGSSFNSSVKERDWWAVPEIKHYIEDSMWIGVTERLKHREHCPLTVTASEPNNKGIRCLLDNTSQYPLPLCMFGIDNPLAHVLSPIQHRTQSWTRVHKRWRGYIIKFHVKHLLASQEFRPKLRLWEGFSGTHVIRRTRIVLQAETCCSSPEISSRKNREHEGMNHRISASAFQPFQCP